MDIVSSLIMYLVVVHILGAMAWLAYRTVSRFVQTQLPTQYGRIFQIGTSLILLGLSFLSLLIAAIFSGLMVVIPRENWDGLGTVVVISLLIAALAWIASHAIYRFALSIPPALAPSLTPAPSLGAKERSHAQETRTSTGTPAPAAAPVFVAAPITETLVGRKYELDHHIGEGGMGLVYAGRDLELGRFVAIKKMRPDLKLNERDKKRFLQEAKLSAALHHPCIVEIYDIAEKNGDIYLVFEFVDGQSMDQRLDSGPMTVEELKPALKYVCQALEFAHAKKVIHRDLKPSNIMLTRQGFAKVVDFGIAREIKDTASRLTNMDTSGTLAYMAPEQELGKYDARSDIYSLGATLYEALCAQRPFPGPNYLLQKEKMVFIPLAEAAPEAPQDFRDAVERCLRYDPKDRYQSVSEFARDAGVS